jgi:hypothetical protein
MVGLIIAFPNLVSGGLGKHAEIDISNVKLDAQPQAEKVENDTAKLFGLEPAASAASGGSGSSAPAATDSPAPAAEDPMEAIKRALQQDAKPTGK